MSKLLICLSFALLAHVHAESLPVEIAQALQRSKLPANALAMVVMPLDSRAPLVLHNADQAMNPASLMKLVTTHAALELLGPTHQWPTELRSAASPINGVLIGDVYLKGYGDPKLTQERVWQLLRDLKASGIREIRGDLVLDRSFFVLGPPTEVFDDNSGSPERPFLVGPDALLMNFKSVRLRFSTEQNNGVVVTMDPPLPEIRLENRLQKNGPVADCAAWANKLSIQTEDAGSSARILLSGSMPAGCSGERYMAALDHTGFAASLVRTLWREAGGVWTGNVRQGAAPAESKVLAVSRSPELPVYLRDINKFSNNLMARQLFLTVGAVAGRAEDGPDHAARAAAAIRRWLASKGKKFDELTLENGSGLSRKERISARHLAEQMKDAGQSALGPEYISSLPLVALDGTMKKRLKNDPVAGQAHIKTGTLKDVRGIAGYVRTADSSMRVVVAILNHPRASEGGAVLDEVLRWAYGNGK